MNPTKGLGRTVRSTLFYIPHEIFGLPIVGFGWALIALVIGLAIWGVIQFRNGRGNEFVGGLPVWGIAAAVIAFLLPRIETQTPDGTILGLPIRGYGVMLILGLISGISLAIQRGKSRGMSADAIFGLAFWLFVGGIGGARLFYVIQKWEEIRQPTIFETLKVALSFTEGGLVVYGSMIGGLLLVIFYCRAKGWSFLATGDLIAPSFFIGLMFGRLGCLLNGCCFGGICESNLPAIQFPQGSAVYVDQLYSGRLIGIRTQENAEGRQVVAEVQPESVAERIELKPGDRINSIAVGKVSNGSQEDPAATPKARARLISGDNIIDLEPRDLPNSSLPVHPTQIYMSVNALFICLLLLLLTPLVDRDGLVLSTAMLVYGVSRFLMEWIRIDEGGQFGTSLTISQWVSLLGVSLAIVFFVTAMRSPARLSRFDAQAK